MKFDITAIGLMLSARQKRILAGASISLAVLGAAAITYAGPPLHSWNDGDTLTAADLNGNFSALDTRIAALEANTPTSLVSESTMVEQGQSGKDLVLQGASLDLTPGTWLVEGFASLSTTMNPDVVQIGLWDDSNSVELPKSRSPAAVSLSFGGAACDGSNGACTLVGLTTKSVITVATSTKIRIKAYRNGTSTIWFGSAASNVAIPMPQRLTALQLR